MTEPFNPLPLAVLAGVLLLLNRHRDQNKPRLRNLDAYTDDKGVIHPIRGTAGYDDDQERIGPIPIKTGGAKHPEKRVKVSEHVKEIPIKVMGKPLEAEKTKREFEILSPSGKVFATVKAVHNKESGRGFNDVEIVNISGHGGEEKMFPGVKTSPSVKEFFTSRIEKRLLTRDNRVARESQKGFLQLTSADSKFLRPLEHKEPQMAPGTSVQAGLAGFGAPAAQVKMFGEWGGAPGTGGDKASGLKEAEAKAKEQEKTKPLPGQATADLIETQHKQERLERLRNRPTAYELIATDGHRKVFLGFTNDKGNRRELLHFLTNRLKAGDTRIDRASKATGTNRKDWDFGNKASDGAYAGKWRITWSGRTEREVISQGEPQESIYSK